MDPNLSSKKNWPQSVSLSFWVIRSRTSSGCALSLGQQGGYLPDINTPLLQYHGAWDITAQLNGDNQKAVGDDWGRGQGVLG